MSVLTTPADRDVVLSLRAASVGFGSRTLWSSLDLDVRRGEFVAVLGANGSGKTTLLRSVLGLQPLRHGSVQICGQPPRRGSNLVGYVPQQRSIDPLAPLRAADLVRMGIDGAQWGFSRFSRSKKDRVRAALAAVGADDLARRSVSELSGGEAQRVRIAQALATDPEVLLCDEPLLSLDLRRQRVIAELIDRRRTEHGTAVLFVTHEINPVLPYVDRVLYLTDERFRLGTVDEVMTSASLTELYQAPVEVIRTNGRILVAGLPDHIRDTDDHHRDDHHGDGYPQDESAADQVGRS